MDQYFKPVLLATLVVLLLNTFLAMPVNGWPIFSYFLGGIIAVFLYKRELQAKDEATSDREYKISELSILGLCTGLLAGGLLSLLFAVKIQDEELRRQILEVINESTRMNSGVSIPQLDDLPPAFMVMTAIFTTILSGIFSFFGSLATLPFLKKKKK